MSSKNTHLRPPANQLGNLLRHWRNIRGKNQLDLSIETELSQRHISFIESGRSVPSPQALMKIAQALDVPLRDRNVLLLSAGYAPAYSQAAWNSGQMQSVTRALERILRQNEPFPALVMDRYWNVLMTNESTPRFFNCFIDMSQRTGPSNILHLVFDPKGMRPFVDNWDAVASSLIQRVHFEAVGRVIDEGTKELLEALRTYPGVRTDDRANQRSDPGPITPMIPISFRKGDTVLNYFSMVTTVGTPQTVAAQELRIESLFPADETTENEHASFLSAAGA
ncbi:MAG: helix-turn-helix transcriptional regulator [Chthoniobacterales bacterium]